MADSNHYAERRRALAARYLATDVPDTHPIQTFGVDHLALICSDLEATIRFYTEVLGMRLTKIVQNRDEPTSTHIFFDMGGGNQLAFFDFPNQGSGATVRGVGSMHHIALKARPHEYRTIVDTLDARAISYSMHGSRDAGSVYLRDPDGILLEVTTGY